jgi:maleylacetate reductase
MPEPFVHVSLPNRIVLAPGALDRVPEELSLLGIDRALLINTRAVQDDADLLEQALGDRFAGRLGDVRQHVPTERAEAARSKAAEVRATGVVALGGGSAIGLAKAIALTSGLPILAVPTTYAGSEMTPVWGETIAGDKRTGSDPVVRPKTVVYDPLLSRGLPLKMTAASIANALAHCVEAVWTPKADPITEVTAVEGARALREGLQAVLTNPLDLDARGNLLYGACLAGSALASAGTGLHHKVCHLLGGTYNLPHAETHAAVLPQITLLNATAVPRAKARLEAALETDDLATGLFDLFKAAGIPTSLRELGLTSEQAQKSAARLAGQNLPNPVPVDEATLRLVLERAWTGERPNEVAK